MLKQSYFKMKAVILAAGAGTRLQKILNGDPKPLLEIRGRPMLEYSLEAIFSSGIKEATIAVGYRKERIINRFGERFQDVMISYSENPRYTDSGSMHSLFLSFEHPEDCLVLDGDIIYDKRIIPRLLQHPKKDAVILSPCSGSGDEVYITLDYQKQMVYLGKKKPKIPVDEFTGISKFSAEFMQQMFEIHRGETLKNNFSLYYEDCAFLASKKLPWQGISQEFAWAEIDKPEDIERAEKVLSRINRYPAPQMLLN